MINPYQQQLIMPAATQSAPPSFNMVTGATAATKPAAPATPMSASPPATNPLDSLFGGIKDFFTNYGDIATGAAALGLLGTAYGDLGDIGTSARGYATDLANTQLEQTAFKPYTITSATGGQYGVSLGPDGLQTTMSVSPEESAMTQLLFGGAQNFFNQAMVDPAQRTQNIYGNMLTAMQPEMQRQQLMNEERLAAQGRLGVSSNMFGGMAPETFQMNKAQQEAMNNAYFQAVQQAQAEQAQQAGLGSQFFGLGYLPQQQLINALAPGLTSAAAKQQADLYGANLFGEATMSGIDAYLASALGRANLMGEAGSGLLSSLLGNTGGSSVIGDITNLLSTLGVTVPGSTSSTASP